MTALSRARVAEVARLLAPHSIPVMPLKGALLANTIHRGEGGRAMTDVDVLVREEHFAKALDVLVAHGFTVADHGDASCALLPRVGSLPVDLHRALFRRALFDLPTWELFARGTLDERSFGVAVILPDPRDVFAHAIGHFAKSRPPPSATVLARDLVGVSRAYALVPREVARHLDAHGLGRAARLALRVVASVDASAAKLASSVLGELAPDRWGDRLSRFAAHTMESTPGSLASLAGQHLLNRHFGGAIVSAAVHALGTARRRAEMLSSSR